MSSPLKSTSACYVSGLPGAANRNVHFSNVGKGNQLPGRYQDPKSARVQQCASEKLRNGTQTDQTRRAEEAKARLQTKRAEIAEAQARAAQEAQVRPFAALIGQNR